MNDNPRRDWVVLVAVLVAGILLGVLQGQSLSRGRVDGVSAFVGGVLAPLTATFDGWGDASTEFFGGVRDARSLRQENRRLRDELAAVANYGETQDRLVSDIERLRGLMGLQATGKTKVYADIIAISPGENRFTISRGAKDGIEAGQPVVASEGLLGVVESVADGQSRVALLGSPAFKVSGLVQGEVLTPGLIQGAVGGRLVMILQSTQAVVPGAEVITTGYSTFIPRGIPIGVVLEVNRNEQEGEAQAQILPHARLSAGQEVAVLQ